MIWNYDVMMQGTWDTNAGKTLNDNSVNIVSNYIDKGKGVLGGHDTIGWEMGTKRGISKLADKFNIIRGVWQGNYRSGYDYAFGWGYTSTRVKINKNGFLTQFPWNLGKERNNTYSTSITYNF